MKIELWHIKIIYLHIHILYRNILIKIGGLLLKSQNKKKIYNIRSLYDKKKKKEKTPTSRHLPLLVSATFDGDGIAADTAAFAVI